VVNISTYLKFTNSCENLPANLPPCRTSGQTKKAKQCLRSCFELFEMFFEVKNLHFLPASLEEAVETEVFHSQTFKQTIQNSFLFEEILYF